MKRGRRGPLLMAKERGLLLHLGMSVKQWEEGAIQGNYLKRSELHTAEKRHLGSAAQRGEE